jgi:parvulin-like peptidyl-prolyl isomerase
VKTVALCGALSLALHLNASAQESIVDGIAAVVNNEVITLSEVRQQVIPREMQLRQNYRGADLVEKIQEVRLNTLNDLIDQKLIVQNFEEMDLTIEDYIVEDRVKTIIREEFEGDRQEFIKALRNQGMTLKEFRELQRERIVVAAMRQRNVGQSVIISPKRVQTYYDENRDEFSTPTELRLRMIKINKTTGEPGSTPESQKLVAEEILGKIRTGADFGRMARMYSNDSMSEFDGDYGWIDRDTLNDTLAEIAFNLDEGEVSDVIDFGESYYILFAEEKKPARVKPLSEVREEVRRKLEEAERKKMEDRWIAGLRKKAHIQIF